MLWNINNQTTTSHKNGGQYIFAIMHSIVLTVLVHISFTKINDLLVLLCSPKPFTLRWSDPLVSRLQQYSILWNQVDPHSQSSHISSELVKPGQEFLKANATQSVKTWPIPPQSFWAVVYLGTNFVWHIESSYLVVSPLPSTTPIRKRSLEPGAVA